MPTSNYMRLRPVCDVAGCANQTQARGLCNTHYSRWRKTGSTDAPAPFIPSACSVHECGGIATRKGLCSKHYERVRSGKSGNPLTNAPTRMVRATCSVQDCGKPAKAHRLCPAHLYKQKMHGSPTLSWKDINPKPPCLLCGGVIADSFSSRVYCSDRCSKRHKAGLPDKLACVICGTLFRAQEGFAVCSPGCAKARRNAFLREWVEAQKLNPEYNERRRMAQQRRRARVKGLGAEDFNFEEIACRDRWVCGLCGERVDKSKKYPHDRSGSVDHILPISKGGAHTRVNVQLAHLGCNRRKHAKTIGQMLLIG